MPHHVSNTREAGGVCCAWQHAVFDSLDPRLTSCYNAPNATALPPLYRNFVCDLYCPSQDLAVVVLLMLIPLLAPAPDGSSGGLAKIAKVRGYIQSVYIVV